MELEQPADTDPLPVIVVMLRPDLECDALVLRLEVGHVFTFIAFSLRNNFRIYFKSILHLIDLV